MARSVNKVILLGNLTRDPILRHTKNGTPVCDFGIATNRTWVTEQGEKREDADFHNIVAWGKLAEIANKYLKKGRKVYLEGRLQTRTYEAQDGAKKSRTEIIMSDMIMLDTHVPGTTEAHAAPTAQAAASNGHSKAGLVEDHSHSLDISPEEIPF